MSAPATPGIQQLASQGIALLAALASQPCAEGLKGAGERDLLDRDAVMRSVVGLRDVLTSIDAIYRQQERKNQAAQDSLDVASGALIDISEHQLPTEYDSREFNAEGHQHCVGLAYDAMDKIGDLLTEGDKPLSPSADKRPPARPA